VSFELTLHQSPLTDIEKGDVITVKWNGESQTYRVDDIDLVCGSFIYHLEPVGE
jgi:sortase (surface protein transpeptidase)